MFAIPDLEELVASDHRYREILNLFNFTELTKPIRSCYSKEGRKEIQRRGLHSMAIQKNNAKSKNRDKDRFISALRMPFEGVFSKMPKRTRYRGKLKVHFESVMLALVHNVKRLCVLKVEAIPIS